MNDVAFSENAREVLEARYLRRNRDGELVESPGDMLARVAAAVAAPELLYGDAAAARRWGDEFFRLMASREFLPNSPTLMNAGTGLNQLGACFVLPVPDTVEDIFEAVRRMAVVQRAGGGTGFSFSHLRPAGDFIATTGGEASGPVSFMGVFDCATASIKQGGRRRGANMGVLRVDHPDILDFVRAKEKPGAFEHFNLSVLVDDRFMHALRAGEGYDLRHPRDGRAAGHLDAGEVFDAICRAAWRTGDPGLVFADTVNAANPTPDLGVIEATNPCGEVPLLACESCHLGSINLVRMLDGDDGVGWERLRSTAASAVRFLDNVIDAGSYPLRAIEKMTRGSRKIGLGVMGFADALVRLGIDYDSDEAAALAGRIMETVSSAALEASRRLAGERGVYPHWKDSVHRRQGLAVRNATRTAVAPTGSIALIAGVSPSIEPLFGLVRRRRQVLDGRTLEEVHPLFRQYARQYGFEPERLIERARGAGGLVRAAEVPPDLKRRFRTALEVPVEGHLRIQAAFQRHVDNSVSKTVNLPADARPGDVAAAYRRAWELGLKGVTVYRDASRPGQVVEMNGRPAEECRRCTQ